MIRSDIGARVFVAATIPLTVAVAAVGALLLSRHAQHIEQHHIESSIALLNQAAILAELPLATGSTSSARNVADFIERSKGVIGLALIDRDGNALENRGNLGATALRLLDAKPVNLMVESDRQLIYLIQPVVLSAAPGADIVTGSANPAPQRVGHVAISISRAQVQASVVRLWWTGATILGVTLALSLLLARWVARSLSRPMVRLSDALSLVARGDLGVRLPERDKGEMRRLSVDFNRMVAALGKAQAGLHDAVAHATDALARRTAEAEAANLAKSRYLAAASHDLRQPAHALSLYLAVAQRIAERVPDEQGRQLHAVLAGMESSALSLDSLLNSVLDISRIDAGVLKPKPEPIAIQEVFDQMIRDYAVAARDASIDLQCRPTPLGVYADPILFARICQNLLANALKFCEGGRVLLTARARGERVLIQVWDQGAGIAPEHIDHVFDEFYQVSSSAGVRAHGIGLGLAIVRRLCQMQSGAISVRSRPGRGSVFSLWLPLTRSTYRFQRPLVASVAQVPSGSVAIVLDDDDDVRNATQAVLREAGYDVVAAANLADAERQLRERGTHAVRAAVVDYRLADGYTGIEVAERLRMRFGETLKVVMVTGDTSPERLQALHESGLLVQHKPMNAPDLLALLV